MTTTINHFDNVIDVRDLIEHFEAMDDERTMFADAVSEADDDASRDAARVALANWQEANGERHKAIKSLLHDLACTGGDHQWRGDWYPITLIRESYFENYARELADDIGAIKDDAAWPYTCIDWWQAARELKMDYTTTEFNGVTYFYQ